MRGGGPDEADLCGVFAMFPLVALAQCWRIIARRKCKDDHCNASDGQDVGNLPPKFGHRGNPGKVQRHSDAPHKRSSSDAEDMPVGSPITPLSTPS